MKTCSHCHQELPISSFHLKGKGYRRPECKDCFNASRPRVDRTSLQAQGLNYRSNKAAYQRFYKYGITDEHYLALIELQGGRCPICVSTDPSASDWQVD